MEAEILTWLLGISVLCLCYSIGREFQCTKFPSYLQRRACKKLSTWTVWLLVVDILLRVQWRANNIIMICIGVQWRANNITLTCRQGTHVVAGEAAEEPRSCRPL
jgi:hypothetical protein